MTIHQIIQTHSRPLTIQPTGISPRLQLLPGIRAVMFDIYGTLLISGSGDVGSSRNEARQEEFQSACQALSLNSEALVRFPVQRFYDTIERQHQSLRDTGIEYPEVDFTQVWKETLADVSDASLSIPYDQLAVEYEVRVNPVWPMPGLSNTLAGLKRQSYLLGIISNAQSFTRELFPALLGQSLEEFGFDPALQIYSYQYQQAKPGRFLYERAREQLGAKGIFPAETLYVGNDLLKDIWPASRVGFRTALFAGDARSLRLRENDPRVKEVAPDVVLTELNQLADCLENQEGEG